MFIVTEYVALSIYTIKFSDLLCELLLNLDCLFILCKVARVYSRIRKPRGIFIEKGAFYFNFNIFSFLSI